MDKEYKLMQKYIYEAMAEITANPSEIELAAKEAGTTVLDLMVQRVIAYTAEKLNDTNHTIIYKMLFDHIWFQYVDWKLIIKQEVKENEI